MLYIFVRLRFSTALIHRPLRVSVIMAGILRKYLSVLSVLSEAPYYAQRPAALL
jgi:hypothetical protein